MLWIAIVAQVAGVAMLNVGAVLQKRGADQVPSVHGTALMGSVKNFLSNKPWLIGWLFISIGSVLNFVALGFAPFSILQPFMAVGIIIQGVFCVTYLKEQINAGMMIAMLLMGAGVIFVGVGSFQQEVSFPDFIGMLTRPVSLVILISLVAIAFGSFLYAKVTGYEKNADIWLSIYTGTISVFSYLFAKGMMGALREFGLSVALFSSVAAWLMLVFMMGASTSSFLSKQVSYQHGRAVLINNLFTAFNIALPVFIGVLVLDEWNGVATGNIIMQAAGLAVILTGVFIMMRAELKLKNACNPPAQPASEA